MYVAPPEIIAEKTWIHAAEGCDIQLVCTLHGDVNSEVRKFYEFRMILLDYVTLHDEFTYARSRNVM